MVCEITKVKVSRWRYPQIHDYRLKFHENFISNVTIFDALKMINDDDSTIRHMRFGWTHVLALKLSDQNEW